MRHPTVSARTFSNHPSATFTSLSEQVLLPLSIMNGLSNLDETYREYSTAPTDDLIRFWRSEVKVTAGRRGGEGIHVDVAVSKSIF